MNFELKTEELYAQIRLSIIKNISEKSVSSTHSEDKYILIPEDIRRLIRRSINSKKCPIKVEEHVFVNENLKRYSYSHLELEQLAHIADYCESL